MAMPNLDNLNTSASVKAAEESELTGFGQLLGKLLVMAPVGTETIETKVGASDVVNTYTVEVLESPGAYVNHGVLPMFWQVVSRELLRQATPEQPWVVGRLVRQGKAYVIAAPTPEEVARANDAIAAWHAAGGTAQAVTGDDAGDDTPTDEPF